MLRTFPLCLLLHLHSTSLAGEAEPWHADALGSFEAPMPIVGGEPSAPGSWPDAAALLNPVGFACTGVLVAPRLVLTAAHCQWNLSSVVLNTVDYESSGESIPIQAIHVYEDSFSTYDVAALELAEPASTPPRPIALDCVVEDELHDASEVAIVGFGATDERGSEWTTRLHEAIVPVVDHDCSGLEHGCNAAVSPNGELIAGGDGTDSCNGDSGGPAYLLTPEGPYLVGLVSRAAVPATRACGDGGIYVRVDAIVPWIEQVTGQTLPRPSCNGMNRAPQPEADPIRVRAGETGESWVAPSDPDLGDGHTFEIASAPEAGTASVDADGVLSYRSSRVGIDSVAVAVTDDGDPPRTGLVEVEVEVVGAQQEPEPRGRCSTGGGAVGWLGLLPLLWMRRRRSLAAS